MVSLRGYGNSAECRNDFLSKKLNRISHQLTRHGAILEISTEHVIADVLAALFQLANYRIWTPDNREPAVQREIKRLAHFLEHACTLRVMRSIAVSTHSACVGSPADTSVVDLAAASGIGIAHSHHILLSLLASLGIGLGNENRALQEDT